MSFADPSAEQVEWRPSASPASLRARARLLARVRDFMAARNVLEVETPLLVSRAVTDPQIHSAAVTLPGATHRYYLHTSPEYAMKRLLAAGSGDIYQTCKVFRGAETSRLHNAEFTMLEWYRIDHTMAALIDEVDALLRHLLAPRDIGATRRTRYRDALQRHAQLDLQTDSHGAIANRCIAAGLTATTAAAATRDELLDFLMAVVVGPELGSDGPEFLTHYPASQAALAKLDADDPRYALRFELYWRGIELANGFEELADPDEQARRFAADRAERQRRGLSLPEDDRRLLAALRSGLPACAGVALGFDRLAMLALEQQDIAAVLAFPLTRS